MSPFWDRVLDLSVIALVLVFGGGVIFGAFALVTNAWRNNRDSERLAILKQQMIEKGMSADDIVRVIEAGPAKEE